MANIPAIWGAKRSLDNARKTRDEADERARKKGMPKKLAGMEEGEQEKKQKPSVEDRMAAREKAVDEFLASGKQVEDYSMANNIENRWNALAKSGEIPQAWVAAEQALSKLQDQAEQAIADVRQVLREKQKNASGKRGVHVENKLLTLKKLESLNDAVPESPSKLVTGLGPATDLRASVLSRLKKGESPEELMAGVSQSIDDMQKRLLKAKAIRDQLDSL